MRKILFNDRFGLTKAVLEGRKTMTRRRIVPPHTMEGKDVYGFAVVKYPRTNQPIEVMALDTDGAQIGNILPKYKVGEVVAVAQAYCEIMPYLADSFYKPTGSFMKEKPGYHNKMFVKADLMPHQIRITNVRIEHIQDISNEECLMEGVQEAGHHSYYVHGQNDILGLSAKGVFSILFDKISGKGSWDKNPWVFVYEFELVK